MIPCNSTCVNQTWSSSANRLATWLFNGNYQDQMNNYNATPTINMTFITNGYSKQALTFSSNPMLTAPYIPLASSSLTIDTWLYITNLTTNIIYDVVFSICYQLSSSKCLLLMIRQNNSAAVLYGGFYNNDCAGVSALKTNRWFHAAFTFDLTTLTEKIYLNGLLENTCSVSSAFTGTTTNTSIGLLPLYSSLSTYSPFQVNYLLSELK
jgi:hypothetical protein